MKFECIPESEFEKHLLKMFDEDLNKRRETYSIHERLTILEEMLMKNQTAGVMQSMLLKNLGEKVETMWGEEGEPSIDQRVEMLEKACRGFNDTVLELEQTKVRLKNTEDDLRQALEKISRLEQSDKVTGKVLNTQADQLDRLNKEVFDEDPVEVDE